MKYTPLITANDKPAIWLNQKTMDEYRPQMRKYYYDETRYDTYLEQLGIDVPDVEEDGGDGRTVGGRKAGGGGGGHPTPALPPGRGRGNGG